VCLLWMRIHKALQIERCRSRLFWHWSEKAMNLFIISDRLVMPLVNKEVAQLLSPNLGPSESSLWGFFQKARVPVRAFQRTGAGTPAQPRGRHRHAWNYFFHVLCMHLSSKHAEVHSNTIEGKCLLPIFDTWLKIFPPRDGVSLCSDMLFGMLKYNPG
jgi:hypothetical protein